MRTAREFEFVQLVESFSDIGYGNMMQIISRAWYLHLIADGLPGGGAFVSGECLAMLDDEIQKAYVEDLKNDPLFRYRKTEQFDG